MIYDFNYKELLLFFIENGYEFKNFENIDFNKSHQLILRHDIDHSIEYAYKTALIEKEIGISSIYFLMLSSNSYNPFTKKNIEYIKSILNLGHYIGLHFDPRLYNNLLDGLEKEIWILKNFFSSNTDIISLHRPLKEHLKEDLINYKTTYDDLYFKKMRYISDSNGEFNFTNPIESKEIKKGLNIQLLLHPIWWIDNKSDRFLNVIALKKNIVNEIENYLINNIKFYNGE